jgi:hypothetical protein
VQVLDRLDEMGLAEDDVHVFGLVDGDDFDVHGTLLVRLGFIIRPSGRVGNDFRSLARR